MTLHEAIEKLLKEKRRSMTTSEIAAELNRNKWYSKKDGSLIIALQVHGRTRNYPQLFNRQGSIVSLHDQAFSVVHKPIKEKQILLSISDKTVSDKSVESNLLDEGRFRVAGSIDSIVPHISGLYCVRIKNPNKLPASFSSQLLERGHNIIYIGKAYQSLNRRFLNQELRASGHGTFFRSIGAVLGYKPPKGQLINRKNKRNFKFAPADEAKIIAWINTNLLVNWVEYDDNILIAESELIFKYKPLLNLDGNPLALSELRILRSECVKIANQVK